MPNHTSNEQKFLTDLETLLAKSQLPAELQQILLKDVTKRLDDKDEATIAQLDRIIKQGAADYMQKMTGATQQLQESGMRYKPKYQIPPNNGANAALFQVMDAVDSLQKQKIALTDEGNVATELMNIQPQLTKLLSDSGLNKGRH